MNSLLQKLLEYSACALKKQDEQGAFPAGRNGGYGDLDTPVRNTAHWTFSFARAFMWTHDPAFRRGAEVGASYLAKCIAACKGGVVMRIAPSKDHTNGVLGPAHVLEALQETAKIEGLEDFGSVAEDFYCRHSFNQLRGCWNRVNPDGVEESPDNTFNHQLYFAAVASQLRSAKAVQDVSSFCRALGETLGVHSNGLIRHSVQRPQPETSVRQRLLAVFRKKTGDLAGATKAKERSYHCYNLHGFSILALGVPDFMSCIEEKWHRIVEFTDGEKFSMWRQEAGKTTMPLVSGQETLACDYALYRMVFYGDCLQSHAQTVEAELDRNQAPCGAACLFSADPETQRARVYRYWRLCGDPVGQGRASHA